MLILNSLTMKNFGPIKDTKVITYEKGLNLIQAENGKGKSNSIYAIEMLLNDNDEGNYEQYINNDCNDFFISLDFCFNNKPYTVSLSCKKAKNVTTERIVKDGDT